MFCVDIPWYSFTSTLYMVVSYKSVPEMAIDIHWYENWLVLSLHPLKASIAFLQFHARFKSYKPSLGYGFVPLHKGTF